MSWRSVAAMVRHPSARNRLRMLLRNAARACGAEEDRVAGLTSPITSMLPDEGWAPLLEIIVRDAPAGAVIEVHTPAMHALAARML